jgi:tRNA (Thr-GGU) A37 N-methylase
LPFDGVFATRSPDRPNPLGLHPVTVKRIAGTRLRNGPIEAIDGTPVIDIKPTRSSHTSLAAENLFLRKQLAFYVERKGQAAAPQ